MRIVLDAFTSLACCFSDEQGKACQRVAEVSCGDLQVEVLQLEPEGVEHLLALADARSLLACEATYV